MISTIITKPAVKGRRAGAGTCGSSIAKDGRNTDSSGATQKAPGRNHVGLLPRRGVRYAPQQPQNSPDGTEDPHSGQRTGSIN
jgi:hypothetical protein